MTHEELAWNLGQFTDQCDNISEFVDDVIYLGTCEDVLDHVQSCRQACPICAIVLSSDEDEVNGTFVMVEARFGTGRIRWEFYASWSVERRAPKFQMVKCDGDGCPPIDVTQDFIYSELRRLYESANPALEATNQ